MATTNTFSSLKALLKDKYGKKAHPKDCKCKECKK